MRERRKQRESRIEGERERIELSRIYLHKLRDDSHHSANTQMNACAGIIINDENCATNF